VYSQDGYRLIRAGQLVSALHAFNEGEITFRAFRAYMGCFELLAIREAAERSTPERGGQRQRRFMKSELTALLGGEQGTSPSRELSSLKSAGLVTFTESAITFSSQPDNDNEPLRLLGSRGGKRVVPVPRRILKFLARCTRPALAKTVIAYLLRGLSLERGGNIRSAGTVKVSWICKLCRLSERAVRSARAELIRIGWITKDTGSYQRKLNRDGAYFVIDVAWRALKAFAPLGPPKCTGSAPPIEKQETPYGSKDQKPVPRRQSGVCRANRKITQKAPVLTNIQIDDLRRLSRLRDLYHQAVSAKWLADSEADLRNFVAAAARATRVNGDPIRVFVGIVRKKLWHHLTNEDDDRAGAALKREREWIVRDAVRTAGNLSAGDDKEGEGSMRLLLNIGLKRNFLNIPPGRAI
jgi:hypothetical protein